MSNTEFIELELTHLGITVVLTDIRFEDQPDGSAVLVCDYEHDDDLSDDLVLKAKEEISNLLLESLYSYLDIDETTVSG